MFFANPGEYEPCGIFTAQHYILIAITIIGIIVALKFTINKVETIKVIRKCTVFVWIFEIIIIAFKIQAQGLENVNNYVPLYYCSLLLYAGLFSSFGKESLRRTGDVFLATGGLIGGIVFLIFPTTSLLTYPMLHLVSIYSMIFHGIMIYLGLLINITDYIELKKSDIINYAILVGIVCVLAYIINQIFDSNLMFISKNFATVPVIEFLYKTTGRLFTPIMIIAQCTLPFFLVYEIKNMKIHTLNKAGSIDIKR